MDLGLTEDQEMLQKVASDFVKAEVPAHQMTQWFLNKAVYRPEIIKKAAELGWLGSPARVSSTVRQSPRATLVSPAEHVCLPFPTQRKAPCSTWISS